VTQSIIEGLTEDFRRRRDDVIELVVLLIVETLDTIGRNIDRLSNRLRRKYR